MNLREFVVQFREHCNRD